MSSTGLVRAAASTLPGDQLYPVKRTWEDVHVLLTFDQQAREALELEHETERLDELKQLFATHRSAMVDFSGTVTRQSTNLWLISGVAVAISANTQLPSQSVSIGDAIHILGVTQSDGAVVAERIELLPADVLLPEVEEDDSFEPAPANAVDGPEADTSHESDDSTSTSKPIYQSFRGKLQSINGNIWVVDGHIVNVSFATIKGEARVGKTASVDGYYDANGLFIVTRIEFDDNGPDSVNDSNDDSHDDGPSTEENHTDDHHEDGDDSGSSRDDGSSHDGGDSSGEDH
jgi:hypothetical protein